MLNWVVDEAEWKGKEMLIPEVARQFFVPGVVVTAAIAGRPQACRWAGAHCLIR